jgi:release factor glutamine methyltransferase
LALDGEKDGLAFYRRIAAQAPEYLEENGQIFLEIGYDQGEAVKELLAESGFAQIRVIQDLAGLDRVVTGLKPCE